MKYRSRFSDSSQAGGVCVRNPIAARYILFYTQIHTGTPRAHTAYCKLSGYNLSWT